MIKEAKLTAKYAPKKLSDIVGQEEVTTYFKSVVARPEEAFSTYVLLGAFGSGKTSTVRAFGHELLKIDDLTSSPNFLEIDSGDTSFLDNFEQFKDFIFQEVDGWKIVVFDEVHLLDKKLQGKLLKDIEDFVGNIFFFFVSTEENGILPTILSRSLTFHIYTFSQSVLKETVEKVLKQENITLQEKTIDQIVFASHGHMRNLLNQIEVCLFQGEEKYIDIYGRLDRAINDYFQKTDKSVIDTMVRTPFEYLRSGVDRYLQEVIVKRKEVFRQQDMSKVVMPWLKMKQYVRTEDDFYTLLYIYKEIIDAIPRAL